MSAIGKGCLLVCMFFAGLPAIVTAHPSTYTLLNHISAGFLIDTTARVDNAASLGINTAIQYGITIFSPSDPVGAEMQAKGMHEIDAGIASELYYYECHRTHTVALPPNGVNTYCATDEFPSYNSVSALLANIEAKLQADAGNPLVRGYWVLDDWPAWDEGSAKAILVAIHSQIVHYTPKYPAVCGFGVEVALPGNNTWYAPVADNYTNQGCDMVGIYSYVSTYPSYFDASQEDFTMALGLSSTFATLRQQGWNSSKTPLIGIGQAFAGYLAGGRYEPGITRAQMLTQAQAFCKDGAISIAWYGWYDSSFLPQTLTPMNSSAIQQGITSGLAACRAGWTGRAQPRV